MTLLESDKTMESLYLLIPLSVALVFFALWVFFKAMDSGQFDDLEGPGMRILQDDDRVHDDADPSENNNKK
jgi:cbb3-type cytochrome oxidase maturation protein